MGEQESDETKPVKKESKKYKAAIWAGITLAAAYIIGASATELGLIKLGFEATVNTINPQSMEIAKTLCADAYEATLQGVQVMVGLQMPDGTTSDTVICNYTGGQTMPFMLFFDEAGEFLSYY
jgi:hypothetical protein